MNRPRTHKKHLANAPPEPTKFSRKDLLKIWGSIAAIVGIVGGSVGVRISYEKAAFAKSLHRTIDGWRETYHLNDDQARRILAIEFAFHGTGNRFTKPGHGHGDTREHHREMAEVMNPEDGERFFKAMEGSASGRTH